MLAKSNLLNYLTEQTISLHRYGKVILNNTMNFILTFIRTYTVLVYTTYAKYHGLHLTSFAINTYTKAFTSML